MITDKIIIAKTLHDCGLQLHDHTKALYKYLTADSAKAVLSNCSLKYSSPTKFNDPFEFNTDIINFPQRSKELKGHFFDSLKETKHLNENEFSNSQKRKYLKGISSIEIADTMKKAFEYGKENSLVLCLSEINDNTLMWSHYANKHTGICLGIRVPEMQNFWDVITLKMLYVDNFEKFKAFAKTTEENIKAYLRWAFTKSIHWSYEKEVRLYYQNILDPRLLKVNRIPIINSEAFIKLHPTQICEIYYGISTSQADIDEIETILKEKKYVLERKCKMEKALNSFSLDIKSLP